jgi:hypothetical protein
VGNKIAAYNEAGSSPKFNSSGLVIECQETTLLGTVNANPHTTEGAVNGQSKTCLCAAVSRKQNAKARSAMCKSQSRP